MKTILTIVLLLVAMIMVKTSNANSQDACTPKYVSCMDTCVAKKAGQDQCIAACQQKNDDCAANIYSTPGADQVSAEQPKPEGMEARDDAAVEASKEAAKDAVKPRAKTPAQTTAKAPQPRRQDIR